MSEAYRAAIFGASGLTGSQLLSLLEQDADCMRILCYARTGTSLVSSSKKTEVRKIDFDKLNTELSTIEGDHLFCCLGTTIKRAGSKEAFRKVDYEYVRKIARLSHARGFKGFHLISSLGADEKSLSFYLRTKAEAENALLEIPFFKLRIYRPSLLKGDRKESRPLENFFGTLLHRMDRFLVGPFEFLRPTDVNQLAKVILAEAKSDEWNRKILEAPAIRSYFQSPS